MSFLPPDPPMSGPPPEIAPRVPKATAESVLAAPRRPVTRWNRRYLAAGAAGLATLVALAFWIGFGGGHAPIRKAADKTPDDVITTQPILSEKYAKGYGDPAVQALAQGAGAPGSATLPPPGAPAPTAPPPAPPPKANPAAQQALAQAQAARTASPFFAAASPGEVQGEVGPTAAAPDATLAAGLAPLALAAATPAEQAAADVQPANGQAGKRQFADRAKLDDYLQAALREPESPWEVKAGTVIPAALLTAIDSDLPGEIVAQVTEPVYDHVSGRTVLIPQGARLIGQYDSQIAYGQDRALIAWNRIVMPNGRSINIGAMEGADLAGASGLHDQVDGHFWQLARGVLLSTVFSIAASEAQDASARSSGNLVLNSAGSGVANEATEVGSQITARDLNRQPTIRIRAGWPLRVLVNKDMILAPYA